MGSEEEFKSTIAEYLESLPTQFCRRVFSNPAACLAIFRLLSTIGKQLVMSMLYLESPIRVQDVYQWARSIHQRTVKSKIHQLRKLQIMIEDQDSISLNDVFQAQLRNALTGGGDFSSFGIPFKDKNSTVSVKLLDSYANQKWESILHFMVGQQQQGVAERLERPSESVRGILKMSKLMEDGPGGMKITNNGFQFLLQDSSSQVWTVLLQYLRLAEMQDMDVVEVLNFLFQLVSLQLGMSYSTERLTGNQRKMLHELRDFGLMYLEDSDSRKFYPTHLITQLTNVGSNTASIGGGDGSNSTSTATAEKAELVKPSGNGYIILETNCRIYAYTDSSLQISILHLFTHLVNRFPNFVTGVLTRDSMRRALSHGITANQIITFLTTHSHPQMHSRIPVLPVNVTDQIRLWERERNRLRPAHAHFYKDFAQKQDFDRVYKYAQDIGVVLWASGEKRQLVVTRQGHAKIVELVKSQKAAAAAAAASNKKT